MNYKYNNDGNEFPGAGFWPPSAASEQQEAPYPQEDLCPNITDAAQTGSPGSIPVGAPAAPPNVSPDVSPDAARDAAPTAVFGSVSGSVFGAASGTAFGPASGSVFGASSGVEPETAPGITQAPAPGAAPGVANGRTPVERFGAPGDEGVPQQQRMFTFRSYYQQGTRPYTTRDENWREPSYSRPHESVPNMYTPGICANQPYSQKRTEEPEPERKPRESTGFAGRFLRAVCLVLVCVVLSGATAYGITEGWFGLPSFRDDITETPPPIINQVVLGGSNANGQRGDGLTTSVVASGIGMSAQDLYEMACSQVVGIRTELPKEQTGSGGLFGPQSSTVISGSGFIISADGYILTNYHVVQTAYENDLPLVVSLHDGTDFEADVIGFESSNDVALVKIGTSGLIPAVIANSDNIRVGEPVYAVGNPFGDLVYTMTEGIVSALDRIVTVDRKSISTFQFSAAVNSGNSGGPVYDTNGEVIGIVSAKIMGDSVEGIGFAIPINDAIDIASELIEHGYITGRPLIGITVETVNNGLADYFGWTVGAYVRTVSPDSAAEKAGMKVGDIIIALGETQIDSKETLTFTLRKYRAGDTATITVLRAGSEIELTVTFDENLAAGQPQQSTVPPGQNQKP